MKIDRKGLELCIAEADGLSNTKDITPQQKRRYAFLLSAISVLKAGQASLRELELENLNETARRNGLPLTNLNDGKVPSFLSSEQQVEARGWKSVVERRDMTEGAPMINHIGTRLANDRRHCVHEPRCPRRVQLRDPPLRRVAGSV